MRHSSFFEAATGSHGSSLIETALVMPILILILCFAIDIGYFFIVAANLVSSSRNAVLYSGQGFVSPTQQQLLSPGTSGSLADTAGVAGLAGGDLSGLANMRPKLRLRFARNKSGLPRLPTAISPIAVLSPPEL
jgi:hypothetical protein